jgi:hypothetical protein
MNVYIGMYWALQCCILLSLLFFTIYFRNIDIKLIFLFFLILDFYSFGMSVSNTILNHIHTNHAEDIVVYNAQNDNTSSSAHETLTVLSVSEKCPYEDISLTG